MTINTNLSRVQYNGNGVTTAFAFASRVLEDSHLRVLRQVIATGVVTELILNSGGADGFSVAGVGGDSCTVNVVTAPKLYTDPDGERLTILRNVPLTQTADYVENDPFPAETHEKALDKLTMIEQQQDDQITRSAKLPETSAVGLNVVLPQTPVNNRALKWDGTTGKMKNSDNDPDQLVADVSGLVDTATTAAATATTQAGISTTQAGLSQQYAQGVPSEPAGFSAKYWRDQAAAFAAPANNWAGTRDPLPTDDFNAGYTNGSYWVNTVVSPKEAFVCIDQTVGAAVWIKTTLTIDELQPLLDLKQDINPRLQSLSSAATITPTSANDLVNVTALLVAATIANPTGTFADGQAFVLRIRDNGVRRALTWGSNYFGIGGALPDTTYSDTMVLVVVYNATTARFEVIFDQSGIGYGQAWVDVTASRAIGNTYTNTTGKPIMVSVVANMVGTTSAVSLSVGSVVVARHSSASWGSSSVGILHTIVPPGATYSVTNTTGANTLNLWTELR